MELSPTECAINALFDLPFETYGRLRYTLEEDRSTYKAARETDGKMLRHLQKLLPDITDNNRESGFALAKYLTHLKTLEGVEAAHKLIKGVFPQGEIFRQVDYRADRLVTPYEEEWVAAFGRHPLDWDKPGEMVATPVRPRGPVPL